VQYRYRIEEYGVQNSIKYSEYSVQCSSVRVGYSSVHITQ
jgi:hypothetical protein